MWTLPLGGVAICCTLAASIGGLKGLGRGRKCEIRHARCCGNGSVWRRLPCSGQCCHDPGLTRSDPDPSSSDLTLTDPA
ncbi:hypothetical protein BJV77DRAFT_1027105 [Russula vinacea]|nr:hypothetical protein BJV77DRAFT_1027105 [Russula vinacea]